MTLHGNQLQHLALHRDLELSAARAVLLGQEVGFGPTFGVPWSNDKRSFLEQVQYGAKMHSRHETLPG